METGAARRLTIPSITMQVPQRIVVPDAETFTPEHTLSFDLPVGPATNLLFGIATIPKSECGSVGLVGILLNMVDLGNLGGIE